MQEAVTWRSVSPDVICWREWDDEIVVFSNLTGNTHLLTPLVALTFRRLVESEIAQTLAELNEAIGESKALGPEAESIESIEAIGAALADLERIGLAVRGSA
jgi:PqqD family protein of HPr-rel-A system